MGAILSPTTSKASRRLKAAFTWSRVREGCTSSTKAAGGGTALYNLYATGIGRDHEIEGLAYDPERRVLLLVSKNPRNPRQAGKVAIYRWSLDTRQLLEDGPLLIAAAAFSRRIDGKQFQTFGHRTAPGIGKLLRRRGAPARGRGDYPAGPGPRRQGAGGRPPPADRGHHLRGRQHLGRIRRRGGKAGDSDLLPGFNGTVAPGRCCPGGRNFYHPPWRFL